MASKGVLNKIVFFNSSEPKTKGLYFAICIIVPGMLSRGSIKFDANKNNEANDIEATEAVSCELKNCPIIKPNNVNKLVSKNTTSNVSQNEINNGILKK